MFPIESFRKTLLKIVEVLQSLEIPFHLTDGVTSVAYGGYDAAADYDRNCMVDLLDIFEFLNDLTC